jgi:hypothetical protein
MISIGSFREAERRKALIRRGGRNAKCDLCKTRPAQHYHELVNRGRTVGNDEARSLSYVQEMCSFLCAQCHERSHNPATRKTLFLRNIELYGAVYVLKAWIELRDAMGTRLDVWLPSFIVDTSEGENVDKVIQFPAQEIKTRRYVNGARRFIASLLNIRRVKSLLKFVMLCSCQG